METLKNAREASSSNSPHTSLPKWRARHQVPCAPDPYMAEGVCRRVAMRMRQVTAYTGTTTEWDTTSDDEEEQPAPRWRRPLKSGLHRTGATTVLNKVTWPYEVVYTSAGKPATYQDISIPLFVHGYLIVMASDLESLFWYNM